MLPVDTACAFLAAALLLALAPGPDNLFVLTQSALHGRAAGISVTMGLCTGLVGHTLAVVFGVAAIIQASAFAFATLKIAGAGYLGWLAWLAFRAKPVASGDAAPALAPSARSLYLRGCVMNLSNPKVALFFLALLPQFADPARGAMAPQLALLGGLFVTATVVVFGGIALLAGSLGLAFFRSPATQRILNRLTGVVFLALALNLAVTSRD